MRHGDYLKEATKLNIQPIDFKDKAAVIKYFTGEDGDNAQIDAAMRA